MHTGSDFDRSRPNLGATFLASLIMAGACSLVAVVQASDCDDGDDGSGGGTGGCSSGANMGGTATGDDGGGDCGDECPDACPPDESGRSPAGDPILLPGREFVLTETDFSMEERGVKFAIRRSHRHLNFVDPYIVEDLHYYGNCTGNVQRARNNLFGTAWNSTLQMYSYWRPRGCDQQQHFRLVQTANLGGYYIHDLFWVGGANNYGQFTGPSDPNKPGGNRTIMEWLRFDASPARAAADYDEWYHYPRIKKNPGVLTTRDGYKYYFDWGFDPNEPNGGNDATEENIIQLLRRKENRYGQGYDYHYELRGVFGSGDVEYLLTDVMTPARRHILFDYGDANCPNHVTSVHLADENYDVIEPNLVEYGYYGPNHPDPNNAGQLMYVRKRGCNCGGDAQGQVRYYEYVRRSVRSTTGCPNNLWDIWSITRVSDGAGRTVVQNVYDPNDIMSPFATVRQYVPDPNDPAELGTWSNEPNGWDSYYDPNERALYVIFYTKITDPSGNKTTYAHANVPGVAKSWKAWSVKQESGNPGQPGYQYLLSDGYRHDPNWLGLMAFNRPDGTSVQYTYDTRGRRVQTKLRDPNTAQWYELSRREYSGFGDFSRVTKRYEPGSETIFWSYGHDPNGNLKQTVGPTVTKGLAEGLDPYQPNEVYTYVTDANDANDSGSWGLATTHTDADGMVTKYTYNTYGHLIQKIIDYGRKNLTHTYEPDNFGRTTRYTDPNGAVTETDYDAAGNVTRIKSPQGQETHYRYDPNTGFLAEEIVFLDPERYNPDTADPNDPNAGRLTVYRRHPVLGNVLSMTQTGIGTTRYGYDPTGRVKWTISPIGLMTEQVYDGFGRLSEVRQDGRTVERYDAYDAIGHVLQMTRFEDPNDPNAARTFKYAYDVLGRQTAETEPDSTTTHKTYDTAGRVLREFVTEGEDPGGTCISDTRFEYDELGRLWKQRKKLNPGGADDAKDRLVRTYRYRDGNVQRTETGPESGPETTTYEYDTAGRLWKTTLPNGTTVELTLNARGDTTAQKTTYPNGRVSLLSYTINAIGQVQDANAIGDPCNPANELTSYAYYPTGQVETRTDPDGRVTHYWYDAHGRTIQVTEDADPNEPNALFRTVQSIYDDNGQLRWYVVDNSPHPNQVTAYDYEDGRGNLTSITYPNGDSVSMTYDLAGRILTRNVQGGTTIGYKYDSRGLLEKRTGTVGQDTYEDTFTYDRLGRMTSAIRKLGNQERSRIEFTHDALGHLLSETQTADSVSKTISYPEYDAFGRRKQMQLPEEDVTFSYAYNAGGAMHTISRGENVVADYTYDGAAVGRRRVTLKQNPNLYVDWDVGHDGLLRLTNSKSTRTGDDPNGARIFASFGYQRAVMGDPNDETFAWSGDLNGTSAAKRSFAYDGLHRLTQVTYGTNPATSPKEVFNMDLAGNRLTYHGRDGSDANYVSNTSNQYTHVTPPDANMVYDAAGNLTRDHRGYEFTYDHDNKLIKVTGPNMPAVQFEYDALGRRVYKLDWSGWPNVLLRRYVSSGQNELAEYDGAGNRLRYFVHGPTYIDERVIMHDDATNKDYVYLLKDLYTVAGLADDRGLPVEYYDYDAYGQAHMYRCAMLPFAADLDGDGDVDNDDLAIFKQCYKGSGEEPNSYAGGLDWLADLDGDGDVDGSDYVLFAHAWNGDGNEPRYPNPETRDPVVMLGSTATSRVGNPYFFTGRRLDVFDVHNAGTPHHFTDDDAGVTIYDYRRRSDEPVLGRFMQRDPAEQKAGLNLYAYVQNSPTRFTDPSGLWAGDDHWMLTRASFLQSGMYNLLLKLYPPLVAGSGTVADRFLYHLGMVNVNQDNNHPFQNKRHFCRSSDQDAADARAVYGRYLRDLQTQYDDGLNEAAKGQASTTVEGCRQAFLAIGRFSHTWQDFYGHAYDAYTDGWDAFSNVSGLTPEFPAYLAPPVWGGEHPYLWEPELSPWERAVRQSEAIRFVREKFRWMITRWLGPCRCVLSAWNAYRVFEDDGN